MGELGAERTLGPAVAFAERMQCVEVGEQLGQPVDEQLPSATSQHVRGEPAEHVGGEGLDVLREAECAALGNQHRAQLPGQG